MLTNHTRKREQIAMRDVELYASISRWSDGTIDLHIEDERSCQSVVSIRLTPETFTELMFGPRRVDPLPATFTEHPERVGKYHHHTAATLGWVTEVPEVTPQMIADWIGTLPEAQGGWWPDTPRKNNKGQWVCVARCWTDSPEPPQ